MLYVLLAIYHFIPISPLPPTVARPGESWRHSIASLPERKKEAVTFPSYPNLDEPPALFPASSLTIYFQSIVQSIDASKLHSSDVSLFLELDVSGDNA